MTATPAPLAWLPVRRLVTVCVVLLLGACGSAADRKAVASSKGGEPTAGRATASGADETPAAAPPATSRLVIVTGPERETDVQIGRDLARIVAAPAGIDLEVATSKGAADNMHRLHDDPAVDLAIVQYDVVQAFRAEAARGNKAASQLVSPLRIVAPLYTQEVYFIVRRDSDLRTVDQIRGRRINLGVVGSGSALTVAAVYRDLFNAPIAAANARYLDEAQALAALTIDRTVDVVVVVAGQPARLLAEMRPEARRFIKLLAFDPEAASSQAAFRHYFPATIRASSYAQWLDSDVPAISVMSFLATTVQKQARLDAFTRSLCRHVDDLRAHGHPKWRDVDVTLKLGFGWTYTTASTESLDRCPGAAHAGDERGALMITTKEERR